MDHPLYDVEKMTDNELSDHLAKLISRKNHAHAMGYPTLVHDIDIMIDAIYAEQERRRIKAEFEYAEKNGIDINKPITLGEITEIKDKDND